MGLTGMDYLESLFMLGRSFWHYYKDCNFFYGGMIRQQLRVRDAFSHSQLRMRRIVQQSYQHVCDNYGVSHE